MSRLPFVPHLSPAAVAQRYRNCPDGPGKARWQVLWLVSRPDQPVSATKAAQAVGFTPAWGRRLLHRWNERGPDGLTDHRQANGRPGRLTAGQQAELFDALHGEPPDGGLWTGPKVAAFARDRFGVAAHPSTGWRWLKRLGFRLVVPRPRHPKAATPDEQRRWL